MILIDNKTQSNLLTMTECVEVLERAFSAIDTGQAIFRPKTDVNVPNSKTNEYYRFGSMEGWFDGIFAIRFMSEVMTFDHQKDGSWREGQYSVEAGKNCAVVILFSSENGEPLALLNDNWIQHMRVGGTAGLGTKLLARKDAETVCMIGSGGMAQTFLEGVCAVRPIKRARVYSPSRTNREAYAAKMSLRLGIDIKPMDSVSEAMAGASIVATCTNSGSPVFEAKWLEPGMHVVCVGTNEVPPDAIPRFDIAVRQGIHSMPPSGDDERHRGGVGLSYAGFVAGSEEEMARIPNAGGAHIDTSSFPKYIDVIAGRAKGRTDASQITFYYCHGNQGLQFASVGGAIYRNAIKSNVGTPMPLDWFVQDRAM